MMFKPLWPDRKILFKAAALALAFAALSAGVSWAVEATPIVEAELATDPGEGFWQQERWSPYLVGLGIGILSWLAFLLSDHPLGVSTAFARTAGMIEKKVFGKKTEEKAYYREYPPIIDWEWMLVVGLFIGALLSAAMSGNFRLEIVPPLWEAGFGSTPFLRLIVAIIGGWLLGFGARWAGGCTSGHGISGTLQLVLSSWLAAICFFIGGIGAALVIYRVLA
ncbi:MAG: YeeE/YedE thiosulfate transporter family protein [Candidatus Sumerlaeota bacterium]